MYNNTSDFDICLIQGDDFNIVYQFTDGKGSILDNTIISKVYMACEALGYQAQLIWDTTYCGFALSIPATQTANFIQTVSNYDITVYFVSNTIQTEIYQAKIQVLLKRNKVVITNG